MEKEVTKRKYTKRTVDFYSVETECKCGCGGKVMNPDDHNRWRKFLPRHANKNGTHPQLGRTEPDVNVEKRLDSLLLTLQEKGPTCLERDLYYYLETQGVKFDKQKRLKRTIADAFIEDYNLAIFADGEYWHSMEEVVERDARLTKMLTDAGYSVIRLPSINHGYNLNFEPLKDFLKDYHKKHNIKLA